MIPKCKIYPVFVPHLGCPNQCVFCNQRRISGSLFPASAESVREGLESIRDGRGYELAFYGGSFTAIPAGEQEALLRAAAPYRESGCLCSIRVSTRPDCVDEAALERLARFGVETVELGAQSMDEEVLRLSGRGHSAGDTERAARLVKRRGLRLILQMMTGLPGDSRERSLETARRLIALRPDGVRIYPTVIVRDTPLAELWAAGQYREHTVEDAVALCAELLPLFEAAGIPVIRLGLNPTEELSGGAVLGGAYHPALGELVKSRILLQRARALLQGTAPGSAVILETGRGMQSKMTGQHRQNLRLLREEFSLSDIRVRENSGISGEKLRVIIAKPGNPV